MVLKIPDINLSTVISRGEQFAVVGKRNRPDPVMVLEGNYLVASVDIPEFRMSTPGCYHFTIWREADHFDL